jgi:hypothetical protein
MKQLLFKIAVFFKRPGILTRLMFIGVSLGLLFTMFIPDFRFNLQMKSPKKITIEAIQKTPVDELPRYIVIDNAQLMSVGTMMSSEKIDSLFGDKIKIKAGSDIQLQEQSYNYVYEQSISKHGDTTLSSVSYPVYSKSEIQKKPDATSSDLTAYVVVKDAEITQEMLDGNKYFSDSTFSIQGQFDGTTINNETTKLLTESGYKVSKTAIVLNRGKKPMSMGSSLVWSILAALFALINILSLLPMNTLQRIFEEKPIS